MAVAPGTGVGVTVGMGVAVGIGVGVGVGPGVGAGVGVGVGVGTAVGAATGTGVATGTTAVSENRTTTDRSLFMTTVACPSRLPSAPVQTTDPGAETVNVTMVPGWKVPSDRACGLMNTSPKDTRTLLNPASTGRLLMVNR